MDSGLPDILKTTFGGVEKMLSGKKYPQNVRAFRLLAEEILRKYIKGKDSFEDLETWMADLSTKSKTAKLWLDGFIRPVLIIMAFTLQNWNRTGRFISGRYPKCCHTFLPLVM